MRRIVADVDTGIDDMLALIYLAALHRAGEIELVAVTATAGNTSATFAANNTRWVLDLCGCRDIPVGMGERKPLAVPLTITPETHGAVGLGYIIPPRYPTSAINTPARTVWSEAIRSYAETNGERCGETDGLELLITGPLTTLIRNRDLADHFSTVTIMGAAVDYPGNTTETAEWNFWVDPDAAAIALQESQQRGWVTALCHLGVTEQVTVDPTDLSRWNIPGQLGRVVEDGLRFYFEFHQYVGLPYFAQIHDLTAAMIALGSVEYTTKPKYLEVDEHDRGAVKTVDSARVSENVELTPIRVLSAIEPSDVLREFHRAVALLARQVQTH